MLTEIKLPKLGETMEEGLITRWLAQEGDRVERGQPLFEVQTDKVNIEYESPAAGYLLRILIPPEQTVPVLSVVGYIGGKGEAIPEQSARPEASSLKPPEAMLALLPPVQPAAAQPEVQSAPVPVIPPQQLPVSQAPGRVFVSPRARKQARESGLDPAAVAGSGPNGRVVSADIARYASPPRAQTATETMPPVEQRVVMSQLRRVMAKRLTESFASIPHFYLKLTADVSELAQLRANLKSDPKLTGGFKISLTDLIARACVLALQDFPAVNSSLAGDEITLHGRVNLGVAVALADGLIVPVVKDAGGLNLTALAGRIKDLAERARLGKLGPDAYTGGTFTLTNLGMLGIEEFAAIINPPEAAILAVGKAMPTVVPQGGGYVTRDLLALTLSCDHRIIDGALGAGFLGRIKELLEAPYRLII